MRVNRSTGGDGWVRAVTVRPQVRIPRYSGIRQFSWLSGQSALIELPRRGRKVIAPPRDPIAELLARG